MSKLHEEIKELVNTLLQNNPEKTFNDLLKKIRGKEFQEKLAVVTRKYQDRHIKWRKRKVLHKTILDCPEQEERPKRIKKPISPYLYFCKAQRPTIKKKNPRIKLSDMSKTLGTMWKNLSNDEKKRYIL